MARQFLAGIHQNRILLFLAGVRLKLQFRTGELADCEIRTERIGTMTKDDEARLQQKLRRDKLCLRFEEQLRAGDKPKIEEFLASAEESDRVDLLRDLLPIELEWRQERSEPLELEAALDRFSEHEPTVRRVFESLNRQVTVTERFRETTESSSSSNSLHGRFEPGQEISPRYRIVSLLGKGGMGEVYRADDLVLGQPVALKFLPAELADAPKRMDYFIQEVRCALKVSHPNVCRVHDIAEVGGIHFISMEYIDGDNLKLLIDRVGRMSREKGLQIARQLCMALEAAHQQGVLHRDLKPANVMIDGQGNVRIADFGLATLAFETEELGSVVGTPAYMAPEQLRSGQTSTASDIYSLGAILYEVFSGRKFTDRQETLFAASGSGELSDTLPDTDEYIRGIIQRCLQAPPSDRPESAADVLRQLPAVDPIQAALEAGKAPSPSDLASAGGVGVLSGWQAALLFLVAGIGLYTLMNHGRKTVAAFTKPAVELRLKAESILQAAGLEVAPRHLTAHGFRYDRDLIESPADDRVPVEYWYRSSPAPLIPHTLVSYGRTQSRIRTLHNPPPLRSGMVSLRLSTDGQQLYELICIPDSDSSIADNSTYQSNSADWGKLFECAGLKFSEFEDTEPNWTPPFSAQSHAWVLATSQKESLRIEAAARNGQVLYFQVIWPDGPGKTSRQWTVDRGDGRTTWGWQAMAYKRLPGEKQESWLFAGTLWYAIVISSLFLTIRNVRLGRCNIRGALVFASIASASSFSVVALEADYVTDHRVLPLLFDHALNIALINGIGIGLMYAALEPLMRASLPQTMIAWNRALNGCFDAMVARDLAIGLVLGVWISCVPYAQEPLPSNDFSWVALMGSRQALAQIPGAIYWTVTICVLSMVFALILRYFVRQLWIACVLVVAVWVWMALQYKLEPLVLTSIWIVFFALLLRFGLLACLAYHFAIYIATRLPLTNDFDLWYASFGLLGAGLLISLVAICCLRAIFGKQPRLSVVASSYPSPI